MSNSAEQEFDFSLVRGDLPFRLQRRFGLIPANGFGIFRRAAFYALLTWLPLAVWAAFYGRALPGEVAEPLMQHFGIHVRFLIAVPLLIIGEAPLHKVLGRFIPYFLSSGLVRPERRADFNDIIQSVIRLRNLTKPWLIIVVIVSAQAIIEPITYVAHELTWAAEGGPSNLHLGFGGWWFHFVSRPIFLVLLAAWLWRLVLLIVLFKRIAGLDLALVPTHPDHAGGLGFLDRLPSAFSLPAFAVSAVVASRLAHEAIYHNVSVVSMQVMLGVFLAIIVGLSVAPLLVFIGPLSAAKREALLDYSTLLDRHGLLVRRRWILGEKLDDDSLLHAQELGSVGDTQGLFESVTKMHTVPIGRAAIISAALPPLIPLLALYSIEVPIKDVLSKLLGILM